jgi:pimeloyl-ACP methyl ester carboxylesterase
MAAIEGQGINAATGANTAGLAFDSAGEGSPHLLFLHGWCGDRSFFAPQFDHFSVGHRVVSVDLPGHGKSRASAAKTVEALAADVAALGRDLGLGRGVMVGHSLGAMVGLALIQQAPDLVSAVIMVDPPPLSQEVWRGFAGELLPAFQGPEAAAARRKFVEQMFLPTDDVARRAQIVESMCAVPNDLAIAMVRAMAAFDAVAILRSCEVPILTIASAVPTNGSAFLLEANAKFIIGQAVGAGHFLQLEVPEQVNPMIERFLSINPETSSR